MTTPDLDRDCPSCGTPTGRGDNYNRAFVPYTPDPNDAQQAADWSDDLPELRGLACTKCGCVLAVIDTRDVDEPGGSTNEYRVDEELT